MGVQFMLLGIVAVALLIVDHYVRIAPLLQRAVIEESDRAVENFQLRAVQPPAATGTVRCGVDLDSCPAGLKCANGYCITTKLVELDERAPLPVLPADIEH